MISPRLISDKISMATKLRDQKWLLGDLVVNVTLHGESATLHTSGEAYPVPQHELFVNDLETISKRLGVWKKRSFGIDMAAVVVTAAGVPPILEAFAVQLSL